MSAEESPQYELLKQPDGSKVYCVYGGKKYHIANPETFEKLGFRFSDVKTDAGTLAKLPEGPQLSKSSPQPWLEGKVVKDTKGTMYLIEQGYKRRIESYGAFTQKNFVLDEVIPLGPADIDRLPPGTKVKQTSGPITVPLHVLGGAGAVADVSVTHENFEEELAWQKKLLAPNESWRTMEFGEGPIKWSHFPLGLYLNTDIQVLIAHGHNFSRIPPEMSALMNLRQVDFSNNRLTELPREMGNLSHLHIIRVAGNRLSTLPAELAMLPLIELNLAQNEFSTVPTVIRTLTSLTKLNLSHNRLTSIADNLLPPLMLPLTDGDPRLSVLGLPFKSQMATSTSSMDFPSFDTLSVASHPTPPGPMRARAAFSSSMEAIQRVAPTVLSGPLQVHAGELAPPTPHEEPWGVSERLAVLERSEDDAGVPHHAHPAPPAGDQILTTELTLDQLLSPGPGQYGGVTGFVTDGAARGGPAHGVDDSSDSARDFGLTSSSMISVDSSLDSSLNGTQREARDKLISEASPRREGASSGTIEAVASAPTGLLKWPQGETASPRRTALEPPAAQPTERRSSVGARPDPPPTPKREPPPMPRRSSLSALPQPKSEAGAGAVPGTKYSISHAELPKLVVSNPNDAAPIASVTSAPELAARLTGDSEDIPPLEPPTAASEPAMIASPAISDRSAAAAAAGAAGTTASPHISDRVPPEKGRNLSTSIEEILLQAVTPGFRIPETPAGMPETIPLFPPSLRFLGLAGNQITMLPFRELAGLSDLCELSISDNPILDLTPLSQVPTLVALHAAGTHMRRFSGVVCRSLPNLALLDISRHPWAVKIPRAFPMLTALQELHVTDVVVRDARHGTNVEGPVVEFFRLCGIVKHPLMIRGLRSLIKRALDSRQPNDVNIIHAGAAGPIVNLLTVLRGDGDALQEVIISCVKLLCNVANKAGLLAAGLLEALGSVIDDATVKQETHATAAAAVAEICFNSPNYVKVLAAEHGSDHVLRSVAQNPDPVVQALARQARESLAEAIPGTGYLCVRAIEALQLPDTTPGEKPYAPYCHFAIEKLTHSTKSGKKTSSPVWDDTEWVVALSEPVARSLEVLVYDYRALSYDIPLGRTVVAVSQLLNGQSQDVWLKLAPPSDAHKSAKEIKTTPVKAKEEDKHAHAHPPAVEEAPRTAAVHLQMRFVPHCSHDMDEQAAKLRAWIPPSGTVVPVCEVRPHCMPALMTPSTLVSTSTLPEVRTAELADLIPSGDLDFYDEVFLGLDCANAVYYDNPISFVHQDAFETAQWSNRFSKQQYLLAERMPLPGAPPRNGRTLYVAFMGSYRPADVLVDMQFLGSVTREGRIHKGFMERANSIPLLPLLNHIRPPRTSNPGGRLVLSGHSLGGAVAVCVYLRLVVVGALSAEEISRIRVFTFGQPLLGDSALAAYVRATGLDRQVHAFVNSGDLTSCIMSISPHTAARNLVALAREKAIETMERARQKHHLAVSSPTPTPNRSRTASEVSSGSVTPDPVGRAVKEAVSEEAIVAAVVEAPPPEPGAAPTVDTEEVLEGAAEVMSDHNPSVVAAARAARSADLVGEEEQGGMGAEDLRAILNTPAAKTVDAVCAFISSRVQRAFLDATPIGNYYFVAAEHSDIRTGVGSGGSEAIIHRASSPDDAIRSLALPEGLSLRHIEQHRLATYFRSLDRIRGIPPPCSAIRHVTVEDYALRFPDFTIPESTRAKNHTATPTQLTTINGDGKDDDDDVEVIPQELPRTVDVKGRVVQLTNKWAPMVRRKKAYLDQRTNVVEVLLQGFNISHVVLLKFRGDPTEYKPVYQTARELRFHVVFLPLPCAAAGFKGELVLRAISHFGEARVAFDFAKFAREMHPTPAAPPSFRALRSDQERNMRPGALLAVSDLGFTRILGAVLAALRNIRVTQTVLRAYFSSDLFQEQLAEAGDVEMQVSHFELERLNLPTPVVVLNANHNEVEINFAEVGLSAVMAFSVIRFTDYLTYRQCGIRIAARNIHGLFALRIEGVDETAAAANPGAANSNQACRFVLDIDDINVTFGVDVTHHGVTLAKKENWGFGGKLLNTFSGYLKGIILNLLKSYSMQEFLSAEIKKVLLDQRPVHVPVMDGKVLVIDYSLTQAPRIGELFRGRSMFCSAHRAAFALQGHETHAATANLEPPVDFEDALARTQAHDFVLVLSAFTFNSLFAAFYVGGWLDHRIASKNLPEELVSLAQHGLMHELGAEGDFFVCVKATSAPSVSMTEGVISLSVASQLSFLDGNERPLFSALLPFVATIQVEDLRFTTSGLQGMETLSLDEGVEGIALLRDALQEVKNELRDFVQLLYKKTVVPSYSAVLKRSDFTQLAIFQGLPDVAANIKCYNGALVISFSIPEFQFKPAEIDQLANYLTEKLEAEKDGFLGADVVDRGFAFLERRVLTFARE